jgi:peptide/nickel transport system permease protein
MAFLGAFAGQLGRAVLLLTAVVLLNFLLIHLAPGDPLYTIAGEAGGSQPQVLEELRKIYGLDRSFLEQFWIYLQRVLTGNLGQSFYFNAPVVGLVLERMPATALLVISALIWSMLLGTALGVLSARKPDGILSHSINVLAVVGYSAPVFWIGLLFLIAFASKLPIFPVSGMVDHSAVHTSVSSYILDVLHHLILPAISLGLIYLAQFARISRASMISVFSADYIRTARAKGLPEWVIIWKHGLRNGMLPVITIVGLQLSHVVSGAVLVETVYDWPGLGRLAYDSILRRDHPTILGILIFSTMLVVVVNLLTDVAYRLADPRVRTQR